MLIVIARGILYLKLEKVAIIAALPLEAAVPLKHEAYNAAAC